MWPIADVVAHGDAEPLAAALVDASRMPRAAGVDLLLATGSCSALGHPRARKAVAAHLPAIAVRRTGAYAIEIARGCNRACPYCLLGWAGRPYREADRDEVRSALRRVHATRVNLFAPDQHAVSWWPLEGYEHLGADARPDSGEVEVEVEGRWALNLGIEGWSPRLRRALGRPVGWDDVEEALSRSRNVRRRKLYLIHQLPGETHDDRRELLDWIRPAALRDSGYADLTMTGFQPLPHTPWQGEPGRWDPEAGADASRVRELLREVHPRAHWLASQPRGRELHEHDVALWRAGPDAAAYLLSERATTAALHSGRWRAVADDVGWDWRSPLAGWPEGDEPWAGIDMGTTAGARRGARRRYWRLLTS